MRGVILNALRKSKVLPDLDEAQYRTLTTELINALEQEFFHKKLIAEINKIDADKWAEGVKNQGDPGNDFVKRWIDEKAEDFDKNFLKSDCRTCSRVFEKCSRGPRFDCEEYDAELFVQSKHILLKIFELLEERKIISGDVAKEILSHYKLNS